MVNTLGFVLWKTTTIKGKFQGNPAICLKYFVMDFRRARCEVRQEVTSIISSHPLGTVSTDPHFMAIWPVLVELSFSGLECWDRCP